MIAEHAGDGAGQSAQKLAHAIDEARSVADEVAGQKHQLRPRRAHELDRAFDLSPRGQKADVNVRKVRQPQTMVRWMHARERHLVTPQAQSATDSLDERHEEPNRMRDEYRMSKRFRLLLDY